MSATRKVVLCFNGSVSTGNNNPDNRLGILASYFMYHPHNSILQIFENCEEENKFHFDGPGADICNNTVSGMTMSKIVGSIAGAIDGHVGMNSIENNLLEAKKILIEQSNQAKKENKVLEIHIFSWSRGGFLAWRLKKELTNMISEHQIRVDSLYMFNIDPVPGGPFDRLRLYWHSNRKDPDIKIYSTTYYSDSGNLNCWPFKKVNTIFFSGLILDEDTHYSKKWVVRGNHEGLAGRSGHERDPNHPEKLAGNTVLWNIVKNSLLKFKSEWRKKIIEEGERSLHESVKQNLVPQYNRGFLSPKTTRTCFIGESKNEFVPITSLAKNMGDLIEGTFPEGKAVDTDTEEKSNILSDPKMELSSKF